MDVKKLFLRFSFWSRFLTFFPNVFFIFEKRWQSSEQQGS